MDAFLASVERRAFVMADMAVRDHDTALDIVQDTMLKMVRSYSNNAPDEWPALFFRILNNRITDQFRKRGIFGRMKQWFGAGDQDKANTADAVDQLHSDLPLPEQELQNEQLGVVLLRLLEELPIRQQQAFTLRIWQGLSVDETARAMNISPGSVKTHLHRALQVMRIQLSEYKNA